MPCVYIHQADETLDQGIAFAPFNILRKTMRGATDLLREMGPAAPDATLPRQKAPRSKKR
jgi:hypothetical protein